MLLSIIIVSYNTRELTLAAIAAAAADVDNSNLLKNQTELIVVDNNSSDDSVAGLKNVSKNYAHFNFQLIVNEKNTGFAQANNVGIRRATGDYILLLNSDTVVRAGALEKLVATFTQTPINEMTAHTASHHGELDRLGILSAALVNPDGSPQPQGGSFPSLLTLGIQMLMLDDLPLIGQWLPSTQYTGRRSRAVTKTDRLIQQDWVNGAAFMIRRAVVEEIGLLEEEIFMYAEDIEYCLRARNHHWDVAIQPQANIMHYGSASSSPARAIEGELKGYLYIWSKHKPLWQMPLARFMIRSGCVLRRWLFGTILRSPARAQVYAQVLATL